MKLQTETHAKPAPTDGSSLEKQEPPSKQIPAALYKRITIYSILSFATFTVIAFVIILSINQASKNNDSTTSDHPHSSSRENTTTITSTTLTSIPELFKLYTKSEWGGKESVNNIKPLVHPIEYVIICHTSGSFCSIKKKCMETVRNIQSYHISTYNEDIWYNFLIGGDGNVYEGRGWDYVNHHKERSLAVSYVGNYSFDELSPIMISALEELLKFGVKLKKLSPSYKLVCHNQTAATLSPGKNVYKEISKLPNFVGHVSNVEI